MTTLLLGVRRSHPSLNASSGVDRMRTSIQKNARTKALDLLIAPNLTDDSTIPLFHIILTTGSGTLSTLNVRSIESVFHANPRGARLRIHQPQNLIGSNHHLDATHPRLRPLLNYGYNITFHAYDLARALQETVNASRGALVEVNAKAAAVFVRFLPFLRTEQFWYANESDLLRLVLLYLHGGTYMDTDMIFLRPHLGSIPSDGAITVPENAVLHFPRPRHPFLAAALNNLMANYDGNDWGCNGPRVLKRTVMERLDLVCKGSGRKSVKKRIKKGQAKKLGVKVMKEHPLVMNGNSSWISHDQERCVTVLDNAKVFFPVSWTDWDEVCRTNGKSPTGKDAEKILSGSYAVHLNNKFTGKYLEMGDYVSGSVCEIAMTKFCNVCP